MPVGGRSKRSKFPAGTSVDPSVKRLFRSKYANTGVALTGTQLVDLARQRRLPVPSLSAAYKFLREQVPELGAFAGGRQKPGGDHYQTIGVSRPGVFFVDYGEFRKEWAGSNGGATGFLVAVENLTNRLLALPTRGKSSDQWLDSLKKFLEAARDISTVYSDRDSVARSPKFRDRLARRYGLNWYFLKKGHKSYLAERYIGFLKRKLGQALAGKTGGDSKRWTQFLKPICDTYNSERVPGTRYRRGSINKTTFNDFVGQLFGVRDPTLERYNSFKAGPFETEAWNRACFKYRPGDSVRILRKSAWLKGTSARIGGNVFYKRSAHGAFTEEIFKVAGRQLRANRSHTRLVPVYSIKEFGERHLHFYEAELRPVKLGESAASSKQGRAQWIREGRSGAEETDGEESEWSS